MKGLLKLSEIVSYSKLVRASKASPPRPNRVSYVIIVQKRFKSCFRGLSFIRAGGGSAKLRGLNNFEKGDLGVM